MLVVRSAFSQDNIDSLLKSNFYAGISLGPESGISGILPKISYYNFQDKGAFETYYAFEGSLWVISAVMVSGDVLYGLKKNSLTLELDCLVVVPCNRKKGTKRKRRSLFAWHPQS